MHGALGRRAFLFSYVIFHLNSLIGKEVKNMETPPKKEPECYWTDTRCLAYARGQLSPRRMYDWIHSHSPAVAVLQKKPDSTK